MSLPPGRVVALSPGILRTRLEVEAFLRAAGRAVQCGLDSILLRERFLDERLFAHTAAALLELRLSGGPLWVGVHDRVHQALAAGASAVHLGFRSLPVEDARRILPDSVSVGFSAHAGDDLERIGADYYFYGPVKPTPSKQGILEPVGFDGLAEACARSGAPLFGLGGMKPEHLARAREAGARGIAVLSGIFGQEDPAAAVQAFLAAARGGEEE